MFKDLIGENVTVVVTSRGDTLLEYIGTLSSESDETIEMKNVSISYLMLNYIHSLISHVYQVLQYLKS